MNKDNIQDIYELSPLQQGILFHSLYSPKSDIYFIQQEFSLFCNLNISAFEQAWQQVVNRHTVLRTSFYWEDLEKPVQVVHKRVETSLEQYDWRNLDTMLQKTRLKAFLESDRKQGFDLSQDSLIRLTLIRLADDSYQFIWSKHHLIIDGWSTVLVLKDLVQYYEAFCQGKHALDILAGSYGDYIAWLQQQSLLKAKAFWRQTLSGFKAPTPLIETYVRKSSTSKSDYNEQQLKLSLIATASLQSLAWQQRLTLSTIVQGAWAILLSRYSCEEDIVYGSIVSGRPVGLAGAESIVGPFISTLPVRVNVGVNEALLPWLEQLQSQLVEMRQYEYSSLIDIQGWSEIPRGVPLFESLLVFENHPIEQVLEKFKGDMDIQDIRTFNRTNYPLTLIAIPGSELSFKIAYKCSLFDDSTITRMLNHLQTLLEAIATNPDTLLKDLPLLTKAEERQLLEDWNSTQVEYNCEKCIHQLFEEQVERTPDAVAVVFETEQITYRELNGRANQLARYLQELGVRPEVLVGICMERSLDMVVGVLGILKAGGAYVPFDPSYPGERLRFMLEDSQVPVLITQKAVAAALPTCQAQQVCVDTDWKLLLQTKERTDFISEVKPDNLAYVIYTSGSTGKPKGVQGLHRGTINRLCWMWETYPFQPDELCCQKTSLSFVDSIWEFLGGLLQGVPTLIIPNAVVKDPHSLIQELMINRVSRIVLVPSLLSVILETDNELDKKLNYLRYWVSSGEALEAELCQKFYSILPNSLLINLYGSSEVSADATYYESFQFLVNPLNNLSQSKQIADYSQKSDYVAPKNPEEEVLAEIWKEVFCIDRISIQDDFFQLGGNSLLAARIIDLIRCILDVSLPIDILQKRPNVKDLAAILGQYETEVGKAATISRLLKQIQMPASVIT